MEIQGKIWGTTALLFRKNNVEIHRICGKKDYFCSKHKHLYKFNMFFVEKGKLEISVWKEDGVVDKTIISDGDSCSISPNQYHQFSVLEDNTVAFEIYWVELLDPDINRESIGGRA